MNNRRWVGALVGVAIAACHSQSVDGTHATVVPRTWDAQALATLEVPLARAQYSPKNISAEAYYRIPVRPIYKSYPKYRPDKEPPAYWAWLKQQEPVVLWDEGAHRPKLVTEEDWIRAGEIVFNAPVVFTPELDHDVQADRASDENTGDLYDGNGVSPFATHVIRTRGTVEIAEASCAECHSRVMPDGTVIRGAQGNRPAEKVAYLGTAHDVTNAADPAAELVQARAAQVRMFAAPWGTDEANARLQNLSAAEIEAIHVGIPAGVFARQGTSLYSPAKIPDLIGIKDRKYLDASGLQLNRGPADIMRYAALNQGMNMLASYGELVPAAGRAVGGRRATATSSSTRSPCTSTR